LDLVFEGQLEAVRKQSCSVLTSAKGDTFLIARARHPKFVSVSASVVFRLTGRVDGLSALPP
jgi:hypothetical protein